MRIWFAAAQTSDTFGGVYRSVSSLGEALKSQGHVVKYLWARHSGKRAQNLFPFYLALRLMLAVVRRPDWIIARSGDGLLCALLARWGLTKTRVALHSHGWEEKVFAVEKRLPRSIVSHPTTWKARLVRFPLLRATLTNAHLCICGTVEEARFVADRYPAQKNKIKVIANGIERMPVPFWPSRHGVPSSFLIVGGFTWKKNIEYGIALFGSVLAALPPAREPRLFLVGTGPLPPHAQKLVDALGDAVFVVEREQPRLMVRWYETCPFLISTSRYEGGRSLALLEAQNRGMVVFATNIPSTREIIHDNKNGVLLDGCDVARDSAKIIETCSDFDRCNAIGTAAWRSAGRQQWVRQGKRLANLLKRASLGTSASSLHRGARGPV